jgi:hypothetical protein
MTDAQLNSFSNLLTYLLSAVRHGILRDDLLGMLLSPRGSSFHTQYMEVEFKSYERERQSSYGNH